MTPDVVTIEIWPIVATIIGSLTPITIAVIVFGFKINTKLTRLETDDQNQDEHIKEIRDFNEKCKAGKVHDRPFGYCFAAFEPKYKKRTHEFSSCER
jgi:hypothetical protein